MQFAPALHVDRKTTHGPCDEARAFARVLQAARGNEMPLPVLFGRKHLGFVGGVRGTDLVWHTKRAQMPLDAAGFPTLAYLQAQRSAGFTFSQTWYRASASLSAGFWLDYWANVNASDPPQGTFAGAANTSVQFTDQSVGAIQHGGNVSPLQKHLSYLQCADLDAGAGQVVYLLYDRVLTYEANLFTAATPQNMTNSLAALRYISAGQPGMQIAMCDQTATGATAANLTGLSYTNNAGTAGRSIATGTTLVILPSATTQCSVMCPTFTGNNGLFLPLAAGDLGVRSIQSYTTSAANTGTFYFVLAFPLAYLCAPANSVQAEKDMIHNHFLPARIYDGACLCFFAYGGNTSNGGNATGRIETVWG